MKQKIIKILQVMCRRDATRTTTNNDVDTILQLRNRWCGAVCAFFLLQAVIGATELILLVVLSSGEDGLLPAQLKKRLTRRGLSYRHLYGMKFDMGYLLA